MTGHKRPRDTNQLAKRIVDVATGERRETLAATPVNEFAHPGGLKGGGARASTLTLHQRKEIAQKAAAARWSEHK